MKENISNFMMRVINRIYELLKRKRPFSEVQEVESMTECVMRLKEKGYLKIFFSTIAAEYSAELKKGGDWRLCWDKGTLIELDTGDEIMYFHFLWLKFNKNFIIPDWHRIPEKFFITEAGLFEEQGRALR
jgi:hypothetical protein